MNIALDATPLTAPTGGVARYTAALVRALAENFPDDRYWLLSDQPFPAPLRLPLNVTAATIAHRRWWSVGLPRELARLDIQVFHGTDFSVPYLGSTPSVMTVHDLSPWLDRSWQRSSARVRRRTPLLLRAGVPRVVITPTHAIRKAAIRRFHLDPGRVIAIPLAASEMFRPVRGERPRAPYFLFVGTLEPRKNITRLMQAWREIRKSDAIELILAGRVRADFAMPEPEPGLRALGIVSDDELPALYAGAAALVYPSLYEGFGLPVLEAIRCGALVITSRDPAITEVTGGNAAIHVDAEDPHSLIDAMKFALGKCGPAAGASAIRRRAIERARCFDWARTARMTREVYAAIAR